MQVPPAKLRLLGEGWIAVGFLPAGHPRHGAGAVGKRILPRKGQCLPPSPARRHTESQGLPLAALGCSPLGQFLWPSCASGWFLLPGFRCPLEVAQTTVCQHSAA